MNKKEIVLNDDDDDFGFSFEDDSQLEYLATREKTKIDELYSLMEKFLDGLSQNPEQTKLNWPNRVEKIKIFKEKLKQIKDRE